MQRLKQLRTSKEITQEELGKQIGQSKSNISKYENGLLEPNNQTLVLIAEFFSVSIDFLLGRTDDPTPSRDINEDMISENIDEELSTFLKDNPEMRVAFMDFPTWSAEDKQELLIYLKAKKMARESKDKK